MLLEDLRGDVRDTPPPLRVQILSSSCSFWENLTKSYVGFEPAFVRRFCGKIRVEMAGQGHVTLFQIFDSFFSFHCHGNQDGSKHSKKNILTNLILPEDGWAVASSDG